MSYQAINRARRFLLCVLLLCLTVSSIFHFRSHTPPRPDKAKRPSFEIADIANGDVLYGDVSAAVRVSHAYNVEGVRLLVDGQEVDTGGERNVLRADGQFVMLGFESDAFENGPHILVAQGDSGNVSTRTVAFNNPFVHVDVGELFDLNNVQGIPKVCRITARLPSAQAWTVRIETFVRNPQIVRKFSGSSAKINLIWDGRTDGGAVMENNPYDVVLTAASQPNHPITHIVNKSGGQQFP